MPEVTKKKGKKTAASAVTATDVDTMDYAELYDKIDAERKVRKTGQAAVHADQIREIRDTLFAAGKDKVSVATLVALINRKFGLEKTEDGDTRVENASVRSAAGSGDFEIVNVGNVAYVVRKV